MRVGTMRSIERITGYEDGYGLYAMDVRYRYDLDRLISRGITDDRSLVEAIRKEAIPFLGSIRSEAGRSFRSTA